MLLWDHSHVHILLVSYSNLLLLLLEELDLLLQCELFHYFTKGQPFSRYMTSAYSPDRNEACVTEITNDLLIMGVISDGLRLWAI